MSHERRDLPRTVVKSFFTPRLLNSNIERLERHLDGVNLKEIPEYQLVVDALDKYGTAVAEKYLEHRRRR